MRTLKLNTKTLVSVAVVAALGMSSNAMAKIGLGQKADVIKLGTSHTPLSDNLAAKYGVLDISASKKHESGKQIKAAVAAAQMLHVNIADFYGEAPRLNAYLDEAMKQDKLIVLENTHLADDVFLDALPFVEHAEVMLLKPSYFENGSKVELFGNVTAKVQEIAPTEYFADQGQKAQEVSAPYRFTAPAEIKAPVRMENMNSPELYQALETINLKINELESDTKLITGGSLGYQCPSDARAERLCYAVVVTSSPYSHVDGDADINILDHYSYAMYRTDQVTAVAVSPNGSANPNLKVDTNDKRAYYLESHKVTINPTNLGGLNLKSRYPQNANNDNTVRSTSGMTYDVSFTAQEKPSMGGSIGYSESNSVSESFSDWETATTTNGYNAVFNMFLRKYQSISDWVTHPAFKKARLHGVPSISKYGLQYTNEGVWTGSKNATGSFAFTVSSETINHQIYFTSNSIFSWNASRNGWIHTLTAGSRSLNLDWLKDL